MLLTGCRLREGATMGADGRPGAASTASPTPVGGTVPTITIIDPSLSAFAQLFQNSLRESRSPFSVGFLPATGTLQDQVAKADLVSGWLWQGSRSPEWSKLFAPLRPLLDAANFHVASILAGAVPSLNNANGELIALPWNLGEEQFYVNDKALVTLGIDPKGPWSLSRLQTTALAVVGKTPLATPVIGDGWGPGINMWAALVTELGGVPYAAGGKAKPNAVRG